MSIANVHKSNFDPSPNPWEEFNAFARKTDLDDGAKKLSLHVPAGTCLELTHRKGKEQGKDGVDEITEIFHTFRFYPGRGRSRLSGLVYQPSQSQSRSEPTVTYTPIVYKNSGLVFSDPDLADPQWNSVTRTDQKTTKVTVLGSERQRRSAVQEIGSCVGRDVASIITDYLPFLKPQAGRFLEDPQSCVVQVSGQESQKLKEWADRVRWLGESGCLQKEIEAGKDASLDAVRASLAYGPTGMEFYHLLDSALKTERMDIINDLCNGDLEIGYAFLSHKIIELDKIGKSNHMQALLKVKMSDYGRYDSKAEIVADVMRKAVVNGRLDIVKALATVGVWIEIFVGTLEILAKGLCNGTEETQVQIENVLFENASQKSQGDALRIAAENSFSAAVSRLLKRGSIAAIDVTDALQNALRQERVDSAVIRSLLNHSPLSEEEVAQVLGKALEKKTPRTEWYPREDANLPWPQRAWASRIDNIKTVLAHTPLSIANRGWVLQRAVQASDADAVKAILENGPISAERKAETLRQALGQKDFEIADLLEAISST